MANMGTVEHACCFAVKVKKIIISINQAEIYIFYAKPSLSGSKMTQNLLAKHMLSASIKSQRQVCILKV